MYPYKTFTVVTDNGPYITNLILKAPETVRAECIDKDTFSVYVERIDPKTGKGFLENHTWPGPKIFPSQGYRPVSAAYPCDENGDAIEGIYLTGNDSGGFFSVSYPNLMTGLACGRTMTFGRRAGMLAATGQA